MLGTSARGGDKDLDLRRLLLRPRSRDERAGPGVSSHSTWLRRAGGESSSGNINGATGAEAVSSSFFKLASRSAAASPQMLREKSSSRGCRAEVT